MNYFDQEEPDNYSERSQKQNLTKKDMKNIIEEQTLSLRKKRNKKDRFNKSLPSLDELKFEIKIEEIEPQISNEILYKQFKSSQNENESLNILMQMLISNKSQIIKYSLANIKNYLINLKNEQMFNSKNLSSPFNEQMIKHLFSLIKTNLNDYFIVSNICFIINKLCCLSDYYITFIYEYFDLILKFIEQIQEPQVKKCFYLMTIQIFEGNEQFIKNIERIYPNYVELAYKELFNLDRTEIIRSKTLLSSLIKLFSNIFYNGIYYNYLFTPINNNNNNPNIISANNSNTKRGINIIKFIKQFLSISFEEEIFNNVIFCVKNFIEFLTVKDDEELLDNNLRKEIRRLICEMEFEKYLITFIYDSSINDPEIRLSVLKIFINASYFCNKKFSKNLIENNIAEQILKLQEFLLKESVCIRTKKLYINHIDLLFNLIESESSEIVNNLALEKNCISNIFKFQDIPGYTKVHLDFVIEIFHLLIKSKSKFIQTLLISEGICEFYKNLLNNNPKEEIIVKIMTDFIILLNCSKDLGKKIDVNILALHLEKIGIHEIINNIRSRTDLTEEASIVINEFYSYFK